MSMLRLQKSWRIYKTGSQVELRSPIQRARKGLRDRDGRIFAALEFLRVGIAGPDHAQALSVHSGMSVKSCSELLTKLRESGCLVEYTSISDPTIPSQNAFDRQERFFSLFERDDLTGRDYQRRLEKATVLIVGLGGYGTWLALLCHRMGIGRIRAIDPDSVELTNLSRQILYDDADVGESKILASSRKLRRFGTGGTFEGVSTWISGISDVAPHLAGVDLVLNPFGYTYSRDGDLGLMGLIASAAIQKRVPCLTFGGSWMGPLTIPGETACCGCVENTPQFQEILALSDDFVPADEPGPAFAPRLAAMASLAVWEGARFLTGVDSPPTKQGIVVMDTFGYSNGTIVKVDRWNQCRLCSGASS